MITRFGVIHSNCGINWSEPENSKKRYIPAVKYQPCSYPFAKCFNVEITGFNIESLEKIAGMILEANKDLANNLTK